MRAAPLFSFECTRLTRLVGWLDDVERCSCIKLLSCKIHELLLMSFPSLMLKSSWIPNKHLELFIRSILLLLLLLLLACCCCCVAAAAATFLLPSFSLLEASTDRIISSMISSITSSSCSPGWLCSFSLLNCKNF
jgi:hypothetical protein